MRSQGRRTLVTLADMTEAEQRLQQLKSTPVDADGVSAVVLGTLLWTVAGLVLWFGFGAELRAQGNEWWLWVSVVGTGLGLLGLPYVLRRRAAYRRYAASGNTSTTDAGQ